ncbi:MAG: hypothetical protein PHP28_06140 [Actinomycetota bacterium]|nr:hypothetical protein [Actinomycetota bacterium]MDD5667310.1 hypothetical protein [Actinomycetota bacterium]
MSSRGRSAARHEGGMKRAGLGAALAIVAAIVLAPALTCGCGAGDGGEGSPREQAMRITAEGSYQVKGIEDGKARGVGIYSDGSFRIVLEGSARMVIFNRETGEGWLVSLTRKTYEPISEDEALLKADFMPHLLIQPYFALEQYWDGEEFRMDTLDGRSILISLGGPEFLPSAWVAEAQGVPFKEIRWEYRRVGTVSAANFQLPEGLSPLE